MQASSGRRGSLVDAHVPGELGGQLGIPSSGVGATNLPAIVRFADRRGQLGAAARARDKAPACRQDVPMPEQGALPQRILRQRVWLAPEFVHVPVQLLHPASTISSGLERTSTVNSGRTHFRGEAGGVVIRVPPSSS